MKDRDKVYHSFCPKKAAESQQAISRALSKNWSFMWVKVAGPLTESYEKGEAVDQEQYLMYCYEQRKKEDTRRYSSKEEHEVLFITEVCSAMMCICKMTPGKISIFLGEKLSPSRGLSLRSIELHIVQHEIQTGSDTKILRMNAMKGKRYLSHISEKSWINNQMVRSHRATLQNQMEPWHFAFAQGK